MKNDRQKIKREDMKRLKNTLTQQQQQLDTYVHGGLKTTRWRTIRRREEEEEEDEDSSVLPRLPDLKLWSDCRLADSDLSFWSSLRRIFCLITHSDSLPPADTCPAAVPVCPSVLLLPQRAGAAEEGSR